DLDHPVLMSDRQDQVPVGRQADGVEVQPIERRQFGDTARRSWAARLYNLAQDGPAVDIQIVEGIPGPRDLKVGVEHDDHHADVVGGSAVDVEGPLCDADHGRPPVGQPLSLVGKAVDDIVPHGGELGVHRGDTGLPDDIAGQVDLAQDIPSAG